MKRTKRVKRPGRIARLQASADVEQNCSTEAESWWRYGEEGRKVKLWHEIPKKRVTINLDADILAWFREMGRGYQWEINRALRRVMEGKLLDSGANRHR
ncbi:MAG TPA: BrnA antitoxin family protein [Terriglobales bacterium]|nr:BrnA antitoxin family protein [Terriglobales bacterium]